MKPLKNLIRTIVNRQNLETFFAYLTLAGAIVVSILGIAQNLGITQTLGIAQVVDTNTLLLTVSIVLAGASYFLLAIHRKNDEILQALSSASTMQNRFEELVESLGVTFTFLPLDAQSYSRATSKIRSLVRESSQEMLVLDYNPLDEKENKILYKDEDKNNEERRRYYAEIIDKVKSGKGKYRYKRILQVPQGRQVLDVVLDDEIFREHCEALIQIGEKQPEVASLRVCVPLHIGTYIIFDRRHLVLEFNMLDPDEHFYSGSGYFFFEDPTGKLIPSFIKFFERADANAKLVKSKELKV